MQEYQDRTTGDGCSVCARAREMHDESLGTVAGLVLPVQVFRKGRLKSLETTLID